MNACVNLCTTVPVATIWHQAYSVLWSKCNLAVLGRATVLGATVLSSPKSSYHRLQCIFASDTAQWVLSTLDGNAEETTIEDYNKCTYAFLVRTKHGTIAISCLSIVSSLKVNTHSLFCLLSCVWLIISTGNKPEMRFVKCHERNLCLMHSHDCAIAIAYRQLL